MNNKNLIGNCWNPSRSRKKSQTFRMHPEDIQFLKNVSEEIGTTQIDVLERALYRFFEDYYQEKRISKAA